MQRRSWLSSLLLLAGCSGVVAPLEGTATAFDPATDEDAGTGPDTGASNEEDFGEDPDWLSNRQGCPDASEFPLAQGLHIRELALYQTVKVPLYENGGWVVSRIAPVVQGKQAMLRVFVDLLDGYQAHDVRARLRLVNGNQVQELVASRTITAPSSDTAPDSTFTFALDGKLLGPQTQLSVSLLETNCGAVSGAPEDTQLPAGDATQPLNAELINKLRVVVVPVDVGGRLPVTTDKELSNMRSTLLAYYPVPDVEISLRAPLVWNDKIEPLNGNSWSDLLNQLMRERRNDAPSANTYYFGLVQPAATFGAYCNGGCVLGLAPQTTSVQPSAQVALGASFADTQTYETMVHELGHAHGRGHAPCVEQGEIDGIDGNFPDPTGSTASWGWDSRSDTLMPPSHKDIMGYCEPNWISAYNYAGLALRAQAVNLKAIKLAASVTWQNVVLYDDGRARWGGDLVREQPAGELESADVLDATGSVIATVDVVRLSLSHAGATFLYLPQPGAQWSALRLGDRTVQLADVLAPR